MKTWIISFFFLIFPIVLYSQNGEKNREDLLKQFGDYNETRIVQILTGEGVIQQIAVVEQYGDNNQSEIEQNGFGNQVFIEQFNNENTFSISQYGENNLMKLKQLGNRSILGKNTFIQLGNSNKFAGTNKTDKLIFNETEYALQEDGATLDMCSFQNGNDNYIGLNQGVDDVGMIQQFGNGNETLLWQDGGGNHAQIMQYGNGNSVRLMQE